MNKVAVVTGSSKGIGYAVSQKLLNEGYTVYGISRSGTGPKSSSFISIKIDLTSFEQLDSLVSKLPNKIEILINDAGLWFEKYVVDIGFEDIDKALRRNLYAPVLLTSKLLSKINSGGTIINISSVMAVVTDSGYSLYCASKAGLDRFTSSLAKERPDLNVIGVLPSGTDTPGMRTR